MLVSYNKSRLFVNKPARKVEDIMARKQNDDLLIEDELAAAFLNDDSVSDDQTSVSPIQSSGDDTA